MNNYPRILDLPIKATAQHMSKVADVGLNEAAAGTDRKREQANAALRNLPPASQGGIKTCQMPLRQEDSQFPGIRLDFILSESFFVDLRDTCWR